jgi:hypothetical protein
MFYVIIVHAPKVFVPSVWNPRIFLLGKKKKKKKKKKNWIDLIVEFGCLSFFFFIFCSKDEIKSNADEMREEQELERMLNRMTLRQRRSYLRKLERGDDVSGITKGDDSDFDFEDSDLDEEEEEDEEETDKEERKEKL